MFEPGPDGDTRIGYGMAMCIAIHFYHVLAYPCSTMDIIHHVVSVGMVGSLSYLYRFRGATQYSNFFMCGLPGGIDYVLLTLLELGKISKLTEKKLNAWLNNAVRWPGIWSLLIKVWPRVVAGDAPVPFGAFVIVTALHGANALYFAQRVTQNRGVYEYLISSRLASTGADRKQE